MSDVYQMKCGCGLSGNELIIISRIKKCPNHPKHGVKHIERVCIDCQEELILAPNQHAVVRCKERKRIGHARLSKIEQRAYRSATKEDRAKAKSEKLSVIAGRKKISAERWDCVHREECGAKIWTDPNIKYFPCYECVRYVSARAVAISDNFKSADCRINAE